MRFALSLFLCHSFAVSSFACDGWDFRALASDNRPVLVERFDPARPLGLTGSADAVARANARAIERKTALSQTDFDRAAPVPFTLALAHPEIALRFRASGLRVGSLGQSLDGRHRPSKFDHANGRLLFNVGFMRTDPDQEFVGALARATFQRTHDGRRLVDATVAKVTIGKAPPEQIAVYFLERAALDAEIEFYGWALPREALVRRGFMDEMTTGDPARQVRARQRYLTDTYGLDKKLVEKLWNVTPESGPSGPVAAE